MAEHDLQAEMARNPIDPGYRLRLPGRVSDSQDRSESDLIAGVLTRFTSTFGTERARFVRRMPAGDWQVHTLQNGTLSTHPADHAEIAMAWMVGLSRFPIRVTRPRVTQPDGGGVRPIAVTSYLGIPVLCGDHLVGIVELAGSVKADLERTLERLSADLTLFGKRLTHDPAIRASQQIDLDVDCRLDGGFWSTEDLDLDADQWAVVRAIGRRALLREVLEVTHLSEERLIETTRALVARGIVSVRASTRVLATEPAHARIPAGFAADGGGV